jgi:hypothetical protein
MESTFSVFKESISEAREARMRDRANIHARFQLPWSEAGLAGLSFFHFS